MQMKNYTNLIQLNKQKFQNQAGFTLVEILLSVALLGISASVASDIILTLIRTYNKTQVQNELEANGNFVIQKIEREAQGASSLSVDGTGKVLTIRKISGAVTTNYVYRIENSGSVGAVTRQIGSGVKDTLTNTDLNGVAVNVGTSSFALTSPSSSVQVLKIILNISQNGDATNNPAFSGELPIEGTIILRD